MQIIFSKFLRVHFISFYRGFKDNVRSTSATILFLYLQLVHFNNIILNLCLIIFKGQNFLCIYVNIQSPWKTTEK